MVDEPKWSPKCPKCGRLCNRVVVPKPNQVFVGRLSPRALEGVQGTRERCPRCATWFVLAEGTEWVLRPSPVTKSAPEGESHDPAGG